MSDVAILLAASALLLVGLCAPLTTPDEVRYSEIPAQMVEKGEWVVPQLHGEAYLDKPPLHYWLVAAGYRAFGVRPELARLASVAAALLCLVALYCMSSPLFGRSVALNATALLAVTPALQFAGRYASLDALFLLLTTVTQLALWRGLEDRDRSRTGWVLIAGACCGLAILTKGPVALVLAVPPVLVWDWLRRRRLRVGAWALFGASATVVAAPWFVAVARRHPEFLDHFFIQHHLHRFAGLLEHQRPWWFYIPVLLIGAFPVSLLLPGALVNIVKLDSEIRRRRAEQLGIVVLAVVWPIVFFSLSSGKLPSYILPAFPFLAILISWHGGLEPPPNAWLRNGGILGVSLTISVLLLFLEGRLAMPFEASFNLPLLSFWLLVWVVAALWCKGTGLGRVAVAILAAFLLNVQLFTTVMPRIADSRSLLGRAKWHAQRLAGASPVPVVVLSDEERFRTPPSYSHPLLPLHKGEHERLALILRATERAVVVAEPELLEPYSRDTSYLVQSLERGGHVYSLTLLARSELEDS